MPRSDGYSTRRIARRIQLHDRLVERKGLRTCCGSWDEASMGPELDYRGSIRLSRLHGLLHHVQVLHQRLAGLQEIRKGLVEIARRFLQFHATGRGNR